jgi:hypothetical protein
VRRTEWSSMRPANRYSRSTELKGDDGIPGISVPLRTPSIQGCSIQAETRGVSQCKENQALAQQGVRFQPDTNQLSSPTVDSGYWALEAIQVNSIGLLNSCTLGS